MRFRIPFFAFLLTLCFLMQNAWSKEAISLVVFPFKNITQNPDDNWLQESFSENLTMGLGKIKGLRLVERTELKKVLQEQSLGQTGLVDEGTAPKLGQLIGVKYVVLGNYQKVGSQILVNVKLVSTETGAVHAESLTQIKGRFADLFSLQEQLAQALIQNLEMELSSENEQSLKEALATTESTTAHQFYMKARLLREKLGDDNVGSAIQFLNMALEEDPRYSRAVTELAGVYFDRFNGQGIYKSAQSDDLAQAETLARKALSMAPRSAETNSLLSRILMAKGEKEQAVELGRQAMLLKKNTQSLLNYVHLKYDLKPGNMNGKGALVESELRDLGADLQDPQVLFTLGGIHLGDAQSSLKRAVSYYQKAREKSPYNPFYTMTLTAVYLMQGEQAKAEALLNPLIQHQPAYAELLVSAFELAEGLMPDLGNEGSQNDYMDYTRAYFYLSHLYLQMGKSNPDNLTLLLSGGRVLPEHMPQAAMRWAEQAIKANPQFAEAYFYVARLYLKQNQIQQADSFFIRGKKHIQQSATALYSAARYNFARQHYAEARAHLDKAIEIWKKDSFEGDLNAKLQARLSLFYLAKIQQAQGGYAEALNTYQSLLDESLLPPMQKSIAHQRMAEIYAAQKQYKKAFDAYESYLALLPKELHSQHASNIYRGYFAQMSLEKAPQDASLLNDIGQGHLVQGHYDKALPFLEKARTLAPQNEVVHYNLGLVYLATKQNEKARVAFEQAIALKPDYAKAYYNLGVLYYESNQADKARTYWQKALKLSPDFSAARDALKTIGNAP